MNSLIQRHDADDLVAFGGGERPRTRATLHRDLVTLAERLPEPASGGRERRRILLVFERDRYHFAVALLAVWARGHLPVVPPDTRRATLSRINEGCSLVLHDTHSGLGFRVPTVLETPSETDPTPVGEALDRRWSTGEAAIEMYGSADGGRQPWLLDSWLLSEEIRRLQEALTWADGVRVAGSVPASSHYALVSTVLQPLATSGSFHRSMRLDPVEWPTSLVDERVDVLVTTPRDLQRGIRSGPVPTLSRIVSFGATLPREVEIAASAAFGTKVVDIFSTTAVGAVAYRSAGNLDWHGFPGVSIAAEGGRLRVGTDPSTRADDLVEDWARADDGTARFRYRGRPDDWVEGHNGALHVAQLEAQIDSLPGVIEAAAVVARMPDPVVLFCVSSRSLDTERMRRILEEVLPLRSKQFDVKVVPRLALDDLGRLSVSRALLELGLGADGVHRSLSLTFGSAQVTDEEAAIAVTVPDNYRWFDGHFDRYPVLPAAIQLHEVVLPCVKMTPWASGKITAAERLKFTGRIGPGAALTVRLRPIDGGLHFDIQSEGQPCSSGRLRFEQGT